MMTSWIDTTLAHNNIWLVLVFHGVDGLGYEALPHELLDTYFHYIKKNEDKLWVATFSEVAKYMRERMHTDVSAMATGDRITIRLKPSLDSKIYDVPLTLKTYVPKAWRHVQMRQGNYKKEINIRNDERGNYVIYHVKASKEKIELVSD